MRRLIAIALVALGLVAAATTAQATSGWVKHRGHYVRWSTSEVRPRLDNPRIYVPWLLARAEAIRQAKTANDRYHFAQVLAARRAAAARAEAARQAAAERATQARQVAQAPPAPDPPSGGGGGGGGGSLRGMVCSFNWSCSIASCIVGRESNWNPRAVNRNSGAAGLFQEMPFWWNGGLWRYNPFDPWQNAYHAHLMYERVGWSPWGGGQYSCGF